jgi:hypothetical protein
MENLTTKLMELSKDGLVTPMMIKYQHYMDKLKQFNPNKPQEWYEEEALKILKEQS